VRPKDLADTADIDLQMRVFKPNDI